MKKVVKGIKHLTFDDFYDKVIVVRQIKRTENKVYYIGKFSINNKSFMDTQYRTLSWFLANNDKLEYIDNFMRDLICKNIFKQLVNAGIVQEI